MGWIVFNSKRCDHAKGCPVISSCAKTMGVPAGEGAVYFDETENKVKVNAEKCHQFECYSHDCMKDCIDCFSYAATETDQWWALEQIHKSADDETFTIIDRYNSGFVTPFSKIEIENAYEYIKRSEGLCILEITSEVGCCSAHDSIPIVKLLQKSVYEKYYKKIVVLNEQQAIQAESLFQINELPVMLFFYKNEQIGRITGIYRNCEVWLHEQLQNKINSILRPYLDLM